MPNTSDSPISATVVINLPGGVVHSAFLLTENLLPLTLFSSCYISNFFLSFSCLNIPYFLEFTSFLPILL